MENDQKYKPGDAVMLIYGGPAMMVEDYLFGDVLVTWLSKGHKVKGSFREESLKLLPKEEKKG